MFNQLVQRAAPLLARLGRGPNQARMLGQKAMQLDNPAFLEDDPKQQPQQQQTAPGADLQRGWVPAMLKQLGVDTFNDRFNAVNGSAPSPETFAGRFQPAVDNPLAQMPGPMAQANPFPLPPPQASGSPFPAPQDMQGYNPHVGDMADLEQSKTAGMTNARQVFDPATGGMMNDFYSKSLPSFFKLFG